MRVYVDGVFDLFHYGHAEMLGRVRDMFPDAEIIVGVAKDEECKKYKRRPVLSQEERIRSVAACRYVDQILADVPWIIDADFLEKYGIDFVCHDETPYSGPNTKDIYAFVKSIGKFKAIPRTEGISTSYIIHKILLMNDGEEK